MRPILQDGDKVIMHAGKQGPFTCCSFLWGTAGRSRHLPWQSAAQPVTLSEWHTNDINPPVCRSPRCATGIACATSKTLVFWQRSRTWVCASGWRMGPRDDPSLEWTKLPGLQPVLQLIEAALLQSVYTSKLLLYRSLRACAQVKCRPCMR